MTEDGDRSRRIRRRVYGATLLKGVDYLCVVTTRTSGTSLVFAHHGEEAFRPRALFPEPVEVRLLVHQVPRALAGNAAVQTHALDVLERAVGIRNGSRVVPRLGARLRRLRGEERLARLRRIVPALRFVRQLRQSPREVAHVPVVVTEEGEPPPRGERAVRPPEKAGRQQVELVHGGGVPRVVRRLREVDEDVGHRTRTHVLAQDGRGVAAHGAQVRRALAHGAAEDGVHAVVPELERDPVRVGVGASLRHRPVAVPGANLQLHRPRVFRRGVRRRRLGRPTLLVPLVLLVLLVLLLSYFRVLLPQFYPNSNFHC